MNIVSTRLIGGLGNMMFQISAAYGLSLRDNKKLICDINNMVVVHKPFSSYVQNIFRKLQFSDSLKINNCIEVGIEYLDLPKTDSDVLLIGYFQSEKYFKQYKTEIHDLFEIDEETYLFLENKYKNVLSGDTCSIHVRRGDYVRQQNFHPTLSIDYYISSIKIIGENKHFVIFSDDIEWCVENFSFLENKTFVTGNQDFQDMYLMSLCTDNIIANSTFSWWGAWLNKNENKKVIIPSTWFGPSYLHLRTDDIYCENWIKL